MNYQATSICVFYDGACPLCKREISLYKKLARKETRPNEIEWIDISNDQVELKKEGIKYEDAMRLIHIKDASGVHQVGLDAIFTLWNKLPYYRQVSRLLQKIPVLHPFLNRTYAFIAKYRMKITGR